MTFDGHWAKERRAAAVSVADLPVPDGPAPGALPPPVYEYAEARSLGDVKTLAAQGWRVHTALLVPASGMKVYLMERERT